MKNISIENIILISFDSLRSDYIANLKEPHAPIFRMMRDEGVFFKNAIVQAPFTIPSHCSILTGLYPAKTGVRDMHHQLPSDVPSIFEILKKEGIFTLSFASTPMLESRKITGIDKEVKLSPTNFAQAINQIKNKPFFAFIHSWDTHTPYNTWLPVNKPIDLILNLSKLFKVIKNLPGGERYNDFIDLQIISRIRTMVKEGNSKISDAIKKGYLGAINTADKFLEKILKATEKASVAGKTLFIIIGDHGDSFNEHNEVHRQADARYEHGHFLYDNILKIPLIFYSLNRTVRKAFDEQVQLIDLVPTIFDALGIKCNGIFDGISLWDALTGQNDVPQRNFTFSEVVRESRDIELRCIRSARTKLIFNYKSAGYELYDLINDPDEQVNLWPKDPYGEKDEMLKELDSFYNLEAKKSYQSSKSDQKKIENVLKALGYL